MARTKLPESIRLGSRVYQVKGKIGKVKSDKGRVWLCPEKGMPFQTDWPMRLHKETGYVECRA